MLTTALLFFRFEQEIAEHPISRPIIATNTFRMASQAIQNAATVPEVKPQQEMPNNQHFVQGAHPRPLLQPSNPNLRPPVVQGTLNQVRPHMQGPIRHPVQAPPNQLPGPRIPRTMTLPPRMPPMVPQMVPNPGAMPVMGPVAVPMVPVPMPVPLPGMPVAGPVGATAVSVMTPEEQKEWGSTYSQAGNSEAKDKKKPKEKKFLRVAGNQVWEDSSLAEWENGEVVCAMLLYSPPKSDYHLISQNNIPPESCIMVIRIQEMITNLGSFLIVEQNLLVSTLGNVLREAEYEYRFVMV